MNAPRTSGPAFEPAERAALEWLALLDAGRTPESWAAASSLFRHTLTAKSWDIEYGSVRACLGRVRARVTSGRRATHHMTGAPPAEYVVLRFHTRFEHGSGVLDERVSLVHEQDGRWRVVGYYVPAPWAPARGRRARQPGLTAGSQRHAG